MACGWAVSSPSATGEPDASLPASGLDPSDAAASAGTAASAGAGSAGASSSAGARAGGGSGGGGGTRKRALILGRAGSAYKAPRRVDAAAAAAAAAATAASGAGGGAGAAAAGSPAPAHAPDGALDSSDEEEGRGSDDDAGDTGARLSGDQAAVFEAAVARRESLFFTGAYDRSRGGGARVRMCLAPPPPPHDRTTARAGAAGTGKTHLLTRLVRALRRREGLPGAVAVTASTGAAACLVGGVTLHSFAGVGLARASAAELAARVERSQGASARWRAARVLVVDEVSMVDAGLFDKLDAVARRVRGDGAPFGGLQLVLCGDFFQLPPVPEAGGAVAFAFESAGWRAAVRRTYTLTTAFRQADAAFVGMLNELRLGRVSDATAAALRARAPARGMSEPDGWGSPGAGGAGGAGGGGGRATPATPALRPTRLFAVNRLVDALNERELCALPGDAEEYAAADSGAPDLIDQLDRGCPAPRCLRLKVGAQVVLLRNLSVRRGLVNGRLGRVVALRDDAGVLAPPRVAFALGGVEAVVALEDVAWEIESGRRSATRRQVSPLPPPPQPPPRTATVVRLVATGAAEARVRA